MPGAIVNKYCKLWSYRPLCDIVQRKVARLTWYLTDRKNFLRRFREEWGIRPGRFREARALSHDQIRHSVRSIVWQLSIPTRDSCGEGQNVFVPIIVR